MQWFVVCIKNGSAMSAFIVVILAILWPKVSKPALKKNLPKFTVLNDDNREVCPGCQKKGTY